MDEAEIVGEKYDQTSDAFEQAEEDIFGSDAIPKATVLDAEAAEVIKDQRTAGKFAQFYSL
jgi:hypothetical protein